MVTAANGYDDHAYTLTVSRQNPAGNDLAAANITRSDTTEVHAAVDAGTDGFTFHDERWVLRQHRLRVGHVW